MRQNPVVSSRWISVWIPIGVGLFILALALSAVFVPQLRLPPFCDPVAGCPPERGNFPHTHGAGALQRLATAHEAGRGECAHGGRRRVAMATPAVSTRPTPLARRFFQDRGRNVNLLT